MADARLLNAPLILTASFGGQDFARLDALRRAHFPPGRNLVPAHLTLFHQLPPTELSAIRDRLKSEVRDTVPSAKLATIRSLGNGVAFNVDSPALMDLRARLAEAWWPLLIPQDRAPWRPHITIQNKVHPEVANALLEKLRAGFAPTPFTITGLALWYYRGGPWDAAGRFAFAR